MFHPINLRRVSRLCPVVVAVLLAVFSSAGLAQVEAQSVPPVGNIEIRDGANPGEVIVSWDAVSLATHYRIGYVNMVTDYPLAKASVTGDWINAFIYVDEDARNLRVSNGRAEYTVRRLQQGARHAFTVLTSNDFIDTGSAGSVNSEFAWPTNPRWEFRVVADQGGACPVVVSPPASDCVSDGSCLPIRAIGSVSGTGDSTQHVFDLSAGLYRFTLSSNGLVSADMVATSPGRDIFYFDFVSSTGARSTEELITVDADDAGPYILEIDAGDTSWEFSIERIGG